MNKQRVLFLCTHNSARSQMAEGFLRSMAHDRFEVASAGTEATGVHPLAKKAMGEVGIDLSGHTSKAIDQFLDLPWDYVITVCDIANEKCPIFPKQTNRLHWSFADPSRATGPEDERLEVFRRVREQIEARLSEWIRDTMTFPPTRPRVTASEGPLDGLRLARTCYAHLAGRLGVGVTDAMVRRRFLKPAGRDFLLTAPGARFLGRLGVDAEKTRRERRAFARQCLDWSERRAHLAGSLGAAVARRCLDLRWMHLVRDARALAVTPQGLRGLRTWFGINWRP